jgi:hypothetical protein
LEFFGPSLVVLALACSGVSTTSANSAEITIQNAEVLVPTDISAVRRGGGVHRTTAFRGPRGGAAVRRTTAVGRPGAHGGGVRRATVVRPGGVRWARPGNYWWRPGGAIAAGAALGFVTAATAVAWAGAAPAPNMCWYYTDPSRTQGFWDSCP